MKFALELGCSDYTQKNLNKSTRRIEFVEFQNAKKKNAFDCKLVIIDCVFGLQARLQRNKKEMQELKIFEGFEVYNNDNCALEKKRARVAKV